MIKVKVKTQWQGKVAVRDRYINECREKDEALVILHGGGEMKIPCHMIDRAIHGVSKEIFRNVHGKNDGGGHRLVYFKWKPTVEQGLLV